jgi:hypothetical protein
MPVFLISCAVRLETAAVYGMTCWTCLLLLLY